LMAVLSGLNSSAISRLNDTWCAVSTQFRTIFDHLNQTFDPKKNFLIYRNKLKDTPPPCIPFFGIYLTDLTFIHQGNPTYKTPEELPTGPSIEYINFDKFSRLVKVVDEIEHFQVPYNLHTED
ncbi:ras GEF, partial [Conidiobolus coronatus NRRL 28638]